MSSPEKRRYFQSLDLINERQTEVQRSRKSQDADTQVKPPQSLKDIFKISNRNRKKNKQKKKVCKDAEPEAEVASLSAIIAAQYKQDASHERPLRQMDDFELMRQLGWINQEQVDSMRKERSRHYNAYQGSTQYNSGGSCNSSQGRADYGGNSTPSYQKKQQPPRHGHSSSYGGTPTGYKKQSPYGGSQNSGSKPSYERQLFTQSP
jgi:hypothetical protein